jgi:hypothetical protein
MCVTSITHKSANMMEVSAFLDGQNFRSCQPSLLPQARPQRYHLPSAPFVPEVAK